MRAMWLCACTLLVGCTTGEPSAFGPVSLGTAEAAQLAARIDASRLALEPLEPIEPIEPAPLFDEEAALAALSAATGGDFELLREGPSWAASDGTYTATRDALDGELRVTGPYEYDAALEPVADGLFLSRAEALLRALAPDLSDELTLQHVAATVRIIGEEPEDGQNIEERLGTKVLAFRTLGGLPVVESELVARYANDGRLLDVRGTWPAIDVSRSKLRSDLGTSEVIARALESLVADGVSPHDEEPIVLESFYELRPDANGWVVVLRASALIVRRDGDGESGRIERHDFDI